MKKSFIALIIPILLSSCGSFEMSGDQLSKKGSIHSISLSQCLSIKAEAKCKASFACQPLYNESSDYMSCTNIPSHKEKFSELKTKVKGHPMAGNRVVAGIENTPYCDKSVDKIVVCRVAKDMQGSAHSVCVNKSEWEKQHEVLDYLGRCNEDTVADNY